MKILTKKDPKKRPAASKYDSSKYPAFAVTVDTVFTTVRNGQLCVLLVQRGREPFEGSWALPGGFVEPNENADQAVARELLEETGVDVTANTVYLEQLKTYSAPKRDPRMRVVSVAYVVLHPYAGEVLGGDDASDARFWAIEDLNLDGKGGLDLAFDHAEIITDGIERVRAKLEYSSLATAFCAKKFSIPELRRVYEAVWGIKITPSNFHRKIISAPGLVTPCATKTVLGSPGGGRRAVLYKKGKATEIFPPLQRTEFN
jgi:8-oxo-dGTP diphosphatase